MFKKNNTSCFLWFHDWEWLPTSAFSSFQRKRCRRCGREKERMIF